MSAGRYPYIPKPDPRIVKTDVSGMEVVVAEYVDYLALIAAVGQILADFARDVPGEIETRLSLVAMREQFVIGHDRNPGARHVMSDLDRTRFFVNRHDLLFGQAEQLDQNG